MPALDLPSLAGHVGEVRCDHEVDLALLELQLDERAGRLVKPMRQIVVKDLKIAVHARSEGLILAHDAAVRRTDVGWRETGSGWPEHGG